MGTEPSIIPLLAYVGGFFLSFAFLPRDVVPRSVLIALMVGVTCFLFPFVEPQFEASKIFISAGTSDSWSYERISLAAISGVMLGVLVSVTGYALILFLSWLRRLLLPRFGLGVDGEGILDEGAQGGESVRIVLTLVVLAALFSGPYPTALFRVLGERFLELHRSFSWGALPSVSRFAELGGEVFVLALFLIGPFLFTVFLWEIGAIVAVRYLPSGVSSEAVGGFRTMALIVMLWLTLLSLQSGVTDRATTELLRVQP